MKIQLSVTNQAFMKSRVVIVGLDETSSYAVQNANPAVYILATALMWLLGAEIEKDAGHSAHYDCDAVDRAHKAIF